MSCVASDGKSRACDVLLAQVRQRLLKFSPPFNVAARHLPRGVAGLPNTQHPNPVETLSRQTIQVDVGNVIERGGPAEIARQCSEPDTRVDLIERRIAWRSHQVGLLSRSSSPDVHRFT